MSLVRNQVKEWGDAALTEPVAVTTWLIFYRSPVFGFDPLLTWAAYLLADAWIGFRIYRSQTPWESVVLGMGIIYGSAQTPDQSGRGTVTTPTGSRIVRNASSGVISGQNFTRIDSLREVSLWMKQLGAIAVLKEQ